PRKTLKSPWPENFSLTESMREYARGRGILNPSEEFENFRLKSHANAYKYADWEKAWQAWCRSPYQKTTQKPVKIAPEPYQDPKREALSRLAY
ncbi:MAG: hypothetical protein VST70_01600, partial [Nitrospirota bacterium]|nr:hypothetical protein [Nitrospirota bacterium]